MSYAVPFSALQSGVAILDFRRRANPIKDQTDLAGADDITRYVHKCCSRLTVPKTLVEITDPIQDHAAHEFSRRVFWGDFNIRYGEKGGRMYHSVIEMPKIARANLVFKEGEQRLYDYDIKSCHPVLLLPLFTDPQEKENYAQVLDHDIYLTIRDVMGVPVDRDEIKIEFMVCTNSIDRYVAERRGVVYQFFKEHFPIFTREVLDLRSDLAAYLQQQESQIMVHELGHFCLARNLFWVPCHDGWLGVEAAEGEIIKKAAGLFFQATGYWARIDKTGLEVDTGNSTSVILGVGGVYGSYVRVEGTIPPSPVRKTAHAWYAALPKHPAPDAETLKERQASWRNRRQALTDHRRRGREAEGLRKSAPRARMLWDELMGGEEQEAA